MKRLVSLVVFFVLVPGVAIAETLSDAQGDALFYGFIGMVCGLAFCLGLNQ